MKNNTRFVIVVILVLFISLCGCEHSKDIPSIYKTSEQWQEGYAVPEYHENKEIVGDYDSNLAAKCNNGTFVGTLNSDLDVKNWRGIPYATIPARFERSVEPKDSDKIYEAYYYGKSCLQAKDDSEKASLYEQDDIDCLSLTVTTANNNIKNKPVLVYIHGGGWVNGGTADPTYEGSLLAYYNPDIILVNIQYRLNFIGMINLGIKDENGDYVFSDYGDKFKTATNNGTLDQIQALRWIKKNISAFGGNPNNITISGESAGCGAVYNLLTMLSDPNNHYLEKSEHLFNKVIAMSGGLNQGTTLESSEVLTRQFLKDHTDVKTIKDIQDMSFEELFNWRSANTLYINNYILDGEVISLNTYKTFIENVDPDITILTGATTNEFSYYNIVLEPVISAVPEYSFDNISRSIYELVSGKGEGVYNFNPSQEYLDARDDYFKALEQEGIIDEQDKIREFVNDFSLQGFNYYLGLKQIKNNGKVYTYSFNIPYDGKYSKYESAHAVDCFYTFGNFDGVISTGDEKQVELSRKWQEIISNFCRNGNPSTDELKWDEYSKDFTTGYIGSDKFEIQKNWKKDRYLAFERMVDANDMMKYVTPWVPVFEHIDKMVSE